MEKEIPTLVAKDNIDIKPIDVISIFQKKYTKEELILEQKKIFHKLDKKILSIKEVLVFFSCDKLSVNISNDLFVNEFVIGILDNVIDIVDYDQYCTDIAEGLTKEFSSFGVLNFSDFSKLNIPSYKKIIYTYLEKTYSFISNIKRQEIGFIHVDEPIHSFLTIFNILLKVKQILVMFFNTQITGTKLDSSNTNMINDFFLQYEFILCLDCYENISRYHLDKFIKSNGANAYLSDFPLYVSEKCKEKLNNLFTENTQYILQNTELFSLISYLEAKHKETIAEEPFYGFLFKNYRNNIFVFNNLTDNSYSYFYDDCITNFNYVNKMIDGLEYTYYMDHFFISNWLNALYKPIIQ